MADREAFLVVQDIPVLEEHASRLETLMILVVQREVLHAVRGCFALEENARTTAAEVIHVALHRPLHADLV